MRSASSINFSLDDLPVIVNTCKQNNIKSYITLNSVIYDNEFELMTNIVDAAKANNVDGIIASDFSVIQYAHSKGLSVHCSTQCNISNTGAVRFFSQFADVMVLARELTLDKVKDIVNAIKAENICRPLANLSGLKYLLMELYVWLSQANVISACSNRIYSANRGECLQLCRRPYSVRDKDGGVELEVDNEYIMSPKDLCTIDFLDKIIDAVLRY